MSHDRFVNRLLVPVRLVAKHGRHAWMHLRRARKRLLSERTRQALASPWTHVKWLVSWVRLPLHRLRDEARMCPACRSTSITLLEPLSLSEMAGHSRVGFVTGCRECGLLFANPLPDPEKLKTFYSPDGTWGSGYAGERREMLHRHAERALAGFRKANPPRRTRDVLLEAIDRHVPVFDPPAGAAVLDFGCGDGKLLNVLLEIGWRTFGIEPSSDVAFLRHSRLETIPSTPQFDLVLMHHVLEHMPQPLDILRALSRAMKPGAAMFISVPRLDTLPQHRDFHYCVNARTHLVSFSQACLRELLARAGLELVSPLTEAALDAQITGGVPLRLRVLARKTDTPQPRPAHPLNAAIRALRAYQHTSPDRRWLSRRFPVRVRAALLDRERRRPRRSPASAA